MDLQVSYQISFVKKSFFCVAFSAGVIEYDYEKLI